MAEEQKVEKPSDRITVTVNKEEKEVFMSGGLIRVLLPHFAGLEDFAEIFSRPEEQNHILVEVLKPRNAIGKPAQGDYSIFDFEMSMEDSDKLLGWVVEHSLHFFIESVTKTKDLFVNNKAKIQSLVTLMESLIGTETSTGMKQSAGDSTQSQAT